MRKFRNALEKYVFSDDLHDILWGPAGLPTRWHNAAAFGSDTGDTDPSTPLRYVQDDRPESFLSLRQIPILRILAVMFFCFSGHTGFEVFV